MRGSFRWWLVLLLAVTWFALPLLATLQFSLRTKVPFAAYANVLADPMFRDSLLYSAGCGLVTIVLSVALLVPTATWVRLRAPRWRPVVEAITLLPFVVPPVVLVFGLIRVYSGDPVPLVATDLGSSVLLIAAYVVLSLPYMYRAIDTGLRAIDCRTLTEAAQSLGAGWPTVMLRVILPNIRSAVLGGAFLTFAIVLGEFTIANFLFRPAFGPYLSLLGNSRTYEPAAVSLMSFAFTWCALALIALVGRRRTGGVSVAGLR